MKKKYIAITALLFLILGGAGAKIWRDAVIKEQEQFRYKKAKQFCRSEHYNKSLIVVYAYKKMLGKSEYHNSKWQKLELEILQNLRDIPRLVFLYEQNPDLLLENEEASLWVARAFFETKFWKKYQKIVEVWHTKKTRVFEWFILEVDTLIKRQKRKQARKKLLENKTKFRDKAELWIRLALMETQENQFAQAWEYLEEGHNYDSKNADLRLFRGQVLESLGRDKSARVEYVAAYLSNPKNFVIVDRLAEFYVRQDNYLLAIETWSRLTEKAPAYIWQKLAFYQRVAINKKQKITKENGMLQAINQLPIREFWSEDLAKESHNRNQYLYWLRVLHFLKNQQYDKALEWLQQYSDEEWNPRLQNNLHRILFHKKYGGFTQGGTSFIEVKSSCGELGKFLDDAARRERLQLAVPRNHDLLNFIKTPYVFPALLLCHKWLEAAVILHENLPKGKLPEWYAQQIMHAMSVVRDKKRAIYFAESYPEMLSLQLLKAELLIAQGDVVVGCDILRILAKRDDGVGIRASWLLSLYYLELRNYKLAKSVLRLHKKLLYSVLGQEVLARIFLLENDKTRAQKIYQKIAQKSVEAKVFLAKEAFQNRNWQEAEKWTVILQKQFPDQLQFAENYNKIQQMKNQK
ncbi:hypothetical protein [Candidatus Uabimicrobium amorphum]|uniref:hypothetical protein n=1 Tax=Uabimicrobium amorphum TaxID=2596890 RepID=UPI00125FEFD6|nr:hypothetical protein [Candidatus Uabimicrobium amorphum]